MNENQLRELLAKGLPKLAAASVNAVYPIGFQPVEERPCDCALDMQAVGSQLLYTRNTQICAFLAMEPGHIIALGQRAFPKAGRMESPRMVVSANGEALNTIMGKLAYVVGKVDEDSEVITAPPIVLNCAGPNRVDVSGADSLFLRLGAQGLSMRIIASVQRL
jgi:hypothetical protein